MPKHFFLLFMIISLSSFAMTPKKFNKLRIKFSNNTLTDNDFKYMNSTLSAANLNITARFYINSMLSNVCFFKKNYCIAHEYATNAYNCSHAVCEISKENIIAWLHITAQKCRCLENIKDDPIEENKSDDLEIIIKNNELIF